MSRTLDAPPINTTPPLNKTSPLYRDALLGEYSTAELVGVGRSTVSRAIERQ